MRPFSFDKLNRFLLALTIILLPFNALPYFNNIFREMSYEGAFYPIIAAMVVWGILLLKGERPAVPRGISAKLLLLFVAWILISGMVNFSGIISASTKGRSGSEKFIFQLLLLSFVILSALLVYQIALRTPNFLQRLRRYIFFSFLVAGAYSALEISFFSGSKLAAMVLEFLHPWINRNPPIYQSYRLCSVSGEPSWLAMYCSFSLPWILSYVFTARRFVWLSFMLFGYLVLLILLSLSRTAYVITSVQVLLFLIGISFCRNKNSKKRVVVFIIGMFIIAFFAGFVFSKTVFSFRTMTETYTSLRDLKSQANVARTGSQMTAFKMANDHPVFGVGLGQYGFYMPRYVPIWAFNESLIQIYMSTKNDSVWPSVHGLQARIAAELGFVGLAIWLLMWAALLFACYKNYRRTVRTMDESNSIFGITLMVSIVGVLLSGFNMDSFRFFGYWIILGIAWAYLDSNGGPDA